MPGLLIVAVFLTVTYGFAEAAAVAMLHRQQGDFVVKIDKALDDHPARTGATALLSILPSALNIRGIAQQALPFAR